jgi:glutamine amidotransferase
MCRALAYLGSPASLHELLYEPDSSLIKQSYYPKMMHALNLAGFGLMAWDRTSHDPQRPFVYKTTEIPVFDKNLIELASKIRAHSVIAHVRGVTYNDTVEVSRQNLHPFLYSGMRISMAHNGSLARFAEMKFDLLRYLKPEIARRITGSTDTEWVYALLLSRLADPTQLQSLRKIVDAVAETLRILRKVRFDRGINHSSPMNLFVGDGVNLVATRFTFDFGCVEGEVRPPNLNYASLWYTVGRSYGHHDGEWKMIGGVDEPDSIIVASEPLTKDISTWVEAPEYSLLAISLEGQERLVQTIPLEI